MISTIIRCSCRGRERSRKIIGIVCSKATADMFPDRGHDPDEGEILFPTIFSDPLCEKYHHPT